MTQICQDIDTIWSESFLSAWINAQADLSLQWCASVVQWGTVRVQAGYSRGTGGGGRRRMRDEEEEGEGVRGGGKEEEMEKGEKEEERRREEEEKEEERG